MGSKKNAEDIQSYKPKQKKRTKQWTKESNTITFIKMKVV